MNQKMKDILRPTIKELRDMIFMLRKNALTMAAVIALILILVIALLAPVIVPYPQDIADKTNLSEKFQPPSSAHLFGTDELGRDVFSRVLYGTRISLSTAVLAVALSLVIGVPLGAVAGTSGGAVDEIIMRITDIFLSFPPMLLAILLVSMLGPSLNNAILAIASLSYLGLGAQAPSPEWGLMISTSRNYFPDIWWYSVFPGLAIFITVLAFNLLGDGVREILDPKTRKK